MTTVPGQCWQVAAGDTNRNYADLCLRHGAIMMGPGSCGSWRDSLSRKTLLAEGWSSRKITNLDLFCNSIKPGDMIVMRLGTSEVHGVGIVRGSYEHSEFFADVDGWDLNHYFRVEWIWGKPNGKPEVFKGALNFGDTTQRLFRSEKTESLFQWIERLPDSKGTHNKVGNGLSFRRVNLILSQFPCANESLDETAPRHSKKAFLHRQRSSARAWRE